MPELAEVKSFGTANSGFDITGGRPSVLSHTPPPAQNNKSNNNQQQNNQQTSSNSNTDKEISLDSLEDDSNLPTAQDKELENKNSKTTEKPKEDLTQEGLDKDKTEEVKNPEFKIDSDQPTEETPQLVKPKRDYTGFKPEDVEVLKKLPNSVFDSFKTRLLSSYKLQTELESTKEELRKSKDSGLPAQYYEHPQSYLLNPEFGKLQTQVNTLDFELDHTRQQLLNVKRGEDWSLITGYKDGQPVYKQFKALKDENDNPVIDHEAEIHLSQMIGAGANTRQQFASKVQELQSGHQRQYQEALDLTKKAEDAFFPSFGDENSLSATIKKLITEAKNKIHPTFQNHPFASMIAKAYAAHVLKDLTLSKKDQEITKLKSMLDDRKNIGPLNEIFNGGGGHKGDKIISEKDFED